MAKEYRQRPGDPETKQWRDLSAGVEGWNNIDRDEAPATRRVAPAPTPTPAPRPAPVAPTPRPAPAPSTTTTVATTEAPLAGLTAISPGSETIQMPGTEQTVDTGDGEITPPQPVTGVASQAIGQLRALGRRTFPMSSAVFTGLRSIY